MENFTRREFLNMTTKFLAGAAVFGILPNIAEGAEKIGEERIIPLEEEILNPAETAKEILPFEMPRLTKFKPLAELKIGGQKLNFVEKMDQRRFTSAIVVHHAGMTYNGDMSLKAIHDLHLGNGWAGVGYHFVVHKDGSQRNTCQHTANNHRHEVLTLAHQLERQAVGLLGDDVLCKLQHEIEREDGEDGLHQEPEAKNLQRHH